MPVAVTSVALNKSAGVLLNGQELTLIPIIYPLNATDQNVTWQTSNPNVCVVDDDGNVISTGAGYCTITVVTDDGGFEATCSIAVNAIEEEAVYGNMLEFFPEQMRTILYFYQEANINNGWGSRQNEQLIDGIIHNFTSETKDQNGNITKTRKEKLWSTSQLEDGWFIEYMATVYRIIVNNTWKKYGGFYSYQIEKLVGTQGSDTLEPNWNVGGLVVP